MRQSTKKIKLRKSNTLAALENLVLYLDTANDETKIAVFDSSKLIGKKQWNGRGDLSETLLVKIEEQLKENQVKLSQLEKIAVNPGPGSYTGLRIGIISANFLAWSLGIPVVAGKISRGGLSIAGETNLGFILPKYLKPASVSKPKM